MQPPWQASVATTAPAVLPPRGDQRRHGSGLRVDVRVGEEEQLAGRSTRTDVPRGVGQEPDFHARAWTPGIAAAMAAEPPSGALSTTTISAGVLCAANASRHAAIVRSER